MQKAYALVEYNGTWLPFILRSCYFKSSLISNSSLYVPYTQNITHSVTIYLFRIVLI